MKSKRSNLLKINFVLGLILLSCNKDSIEKLPTGNYQVEKTSVNLNGTIESDFFIAIGPHRSDDSKILIFNFEVNAVIQRLYFRFSDGFCSIGDDFQNTLNYEISEYSVGDGTLTVKIIPKYDSDYNHINLSFKYID